MRRHPWILLLAALLLAAPACANYRLVRMDEVTLPNYEPRPIPIPESCEALLRRAGEGGVRQFSEAETRELNYCQQQYIIRAQEEEAASRRLEAHAAAAGFVLQVTTVVVGTLIAVLTWLF
jgi:hypothetical protein